MAETPGVAPGNGNGGLLRVVDSRPGYCHNCLGPNVVAVLELRDWRHRFDLCVPCLERLARAASDVTARVASELRRDVDATTREVRRDPGP